MNWDAIGAVGEILGAVAVLVTLVYLAAQVRQARNSLRIDGIRANREERREYFTDARDSPYLAEIYSKIESGASLTPADKFRLLNHYAILWGLQYSEWLQTQMDVIGTYKTSHEASVAFNLSMPGSREWFETYGTKIYPPDFVSFVKSYETGADDMGGMAWLNLFDNLSPKEAEEDDPESDA